MGVYAFSLAYMRSLRRIRALLGVYAFSSVYMRSLGGDSGARGIRIRMLVEDDYVTSVTSVRECEVYGLMATMTRNTWKRTLVVGKHGSTIDSKDLRFRERGEE